MKATWVLPIFAISCLGAYSAMGETLDLTLQRAVQLSLAKNFRIKVEEFSPKIAKARQMSASGKFDPVLEASYTYDQNDTELRTLTSNLETPTAEPGSPDPDLFATQAGSEIDLSVAGLLPTGTTYDIGPSLTFDTDTRRDPSFTRYDTFTGMTVTQPLLKNFGTDVNLASIRVARADQAISQWQLRQEVIDVVTDTISTYSELYFAIGNLDVEKRSRDLAAQLVKDNTKRAEIGVMIELDVMQAQTDLAAREERVLVAERAVADNENFLKQLVTDEIGGILDTQLSIAAPMLPAMPPPNRVEDYGKAFELRPDYRQQLLDIQKRQINVVFTRNQALPRLDLTGSLGLNGIDTGLASSFERVAGSGNRNVAAEVGAIFSVPIPNREGRGNLNVSKLEALRALVELKRLEQAILVEADNAAGQIDTTKKRIEASRIAKDFAYQTLKAAQERLNNGRSTTFEVLQFQRDYATAQASELRARADYIKAVANYARLTGTTLEKNGIVLE